MPSFTLPEPLPQLLNEETLRQLLSPSDLVILAVLLTAFLLGCRRGLVRTVFGVGAKLAALVGAGFAAKLAAPHMARLLVMPIVGDVFQRQATATLQASAGAAPTGAALLDSLSATLQGLLSSDAIAAAAQPIQQAAAQAAQRMAESLSYVLLFFIFLFAFTALLRLIGGALNLVARLGPVGLLNGLAGGVLGAVSGLLLVMLVLWVLVHFAPATFTELGVLSPAALSKTLLTKTLLGRIAPAI